MDMKYQLHIHTSACRIHRPIHQHPADLYLNAEIASALKAARFLSQPLIRVELQLGSMLYQSWPPFSFREDEANPFGQRVDQ